MCGLAGVYSADGIGQILIQGMTEAIGHRGPNGLGFFHGERVSLGHARLSIIDVENGRQPVYNEDRSVVVVFNGEIFNYRELAGFLRGKGHVLCSDSDSAILPHLYEEFGLDLFLRLDGQFAIALWDGKKQALTIARDRFGEKPLYYAGVKQRFLFASEAKAILKSNLVEPVISAAAIGRVFSCWSAMGYESVFEQIRILPEGCYLTLKSGGTKLVRYHDPFASSQSPSAFKDEQDAVEELDALLRDSVRRRMVSDVPLAFMLSGGLDSSLLTAIGAKEGQQAPKTFSVTFSEHPHLDEERHQRNVVDALGTEHYALDFSSASIPELIRDVVWHTEEPFVRPAVFPTFALTRFLRSKGVKVALTGEGADEIFAGYDLHRAAKLNGLIDSRPGEGRFRWMAEHLRIDAPVADNPHFDQVLGFMRQPPYAEAYRSHIGKWKSASQLHFLFSSEAKQGIAAGDGRPMWDDILPADRLNRLSPLKRALHIDQMLLLTNYHLSVQGDRVGMAHAVECRYPFLDGRVVDFAAALPERLLMKGVSGKSILKRLAARYVPADVLSRRKFVYQSPMSVNELFQNEEIAWLLSPGELKSAGIFDPQVAGKYISMRKRGGGDTESNVSAVLGILTTQYLHHLFVRPPRGRAVGVSGLSDQ
jgi:asparagine synthase (glutamine-hydrolysing)